MRTLGQISKILNRPTVFLAGLQKRFQLPPLTAAGYLPAHLEFFRTVIALRSLGISEDALLDVWHLEKKLLELLHAEANGSATWLIDACGQKADRNRRLLLTNFDMGMDLSAPGLQLGLNFVERPRELFAGEEMGEDAIRVLREYLTLRKRILSEVAEEIPHLRAAINWAAPLGKRRKDEQGSNEE